MARRFLTAVLAAAAIAIVTAGAVLAGEVTGTGESLEPLHANSICAYSGLNDKVPGEGPTDELVQSYGWVVRSVGGGVLGGIPGEACRGGSN